MRLAYFRKKDSTAEALENLPELREVILSRMLVSASILGFIALIVGIVPRLQQREWGVAFVYGLGYVWTLYIALRKKVSYHIRAFSFLAVVLALGISTLLVDGLFGNGRMFLLALPLLAGILLGTGGGVWMLVISILAFGSTAYFMWNGILPIPELPVGAGNTSLFSWLAVLAVFVLVSVVITISLSLMTKGIENSAIKQKRLSQILDIERAQLEHRVIQRTQDIDRRLAQLRTAEELTRTISGFLDPDVLLSEVVELIQNRFDLYHVGVFLLDDGGAYARLRAGSGEAGRKMLENNQRLVVDDQSMIGWACKHKEPRISLDIGRDAALFDNPDLPLTRSELGLPLIYAQRVLGAMSVQSKQASAFDQNDMMIFQGIADALATALENTRLFGQVQRDLENSRTLNRRYVVEAWQQVIHAGEVKPYTSFDHQQEKSSSLSSAQFAISLRDQVIGRLTLEDENLSLSTEDVDFIEAVTIQAALALENVRLLEEIQSRAQLESLVGKVSARVQSSLNLDTVLRTAVREIGLVVNASKVQLRLTNGNPDGNQDDQGVAE